MHFYIIEKLNLIVGWNPKVACTTIKTLLLKKLGYEIKINVHEMLNDENLQSGKYNILYFNPKLNNINLNNYTKICFVRNPYQRLISGIRQRSEFLNNFKRYGDLSKNTINKFLKNLEKYNYVEHHFIPQTDNINGCKFNHIIDIKNMKELYNILELDYSNEHFGGHATKYIDNIKINYYNLTLKEIEVNYNKEWSKNIYSWFTKNDIILINKLYEKDFIFLKKNGFNYEIK